MARDSMHPWLDRLSLGELESSGASPRSAFGWREWDGNDASRVSRSDERPANPDILAIPVTVPLQVQEDPREAAEDFEDDFDFTVASY
jgi:hypothetical protein